MVTGEGIKEKHGNAVNGKHDNKVSSSPRKAFLVCYGGAHARIIINLSRELLKRNYKVTCLALNTARRPVEAFGKSLDKQPEKESRDVHTAAGRVTGNMLRDPEKSGCFRIFGVSEILNEIRKQDGSKVCHSDNDIYLNPFSETGFFSEASLKKAFLAADSLHPITEHAVSYEETRAYIGVSMACLIRNRGYKKACAEYKKLGRRAFLPLEFAAAALELFSPEIVFATNSPRMERAFCMGAQRLNIPAVGICDFFGNSELAPLEASKICVINNFTREKLISRGYEPERIFVTGQPGMDDAVDLGRKKTGSCFCPYDEIRFEKCVSNKTRSEKVLCKSHNFRLLLAAQPGKTGVDASLRIIEELARIDEKYSSLKVRVTIHPSSSSAERLKIRKNAEKYGFIVCSGASRNYFSWADTVVSGFSTTLLEAAHAGLRPISVQNDPTDDIDPHVISICRPENLLQELDKPFKPAHENLPYLGCASQQVADMAEKWFYR